MSFLPSGVNGIGSSKGWKYFQVLFSADKGDPTDKDDTTVTSCDRITSYKPTSLLSTNSFHFRFHLAVPAPKPWRSNISY